MPDILRDILKYDDKAIDSILGVNEQIQGIELLRNIPPEEKLYQWLTDTSSHALKRNFNIEQLAYANTEQFDQYRDHIFPTPQYSRSQVREHGKSIAPFRRPMMNMINPMIENAEKEAQQNTPFDQIYHKERKLVADIVKAENQLKLIEESLPNPAGHSLFDPAMMEEDEVYGNMFEDLQPQYMRDKRNRNRLEQRRTNASIFDESEELSHAYNEQKT